VKGDVEKFRAENPTFHGEVPPDIVTASGSGLDPHISPEAALAQVDRVAAARNIPADRLQKLVGSYTEGRQLGIFGEPRVNVLRLNLALDRGEL
jgi:K+-transporting ATPase ATPase C chain